MKCAAENACVANETACFSSERLFSSVVRPGGTPERSQWSAQRHHRSQRFGNCIPKGCQKGECRSLPIQRVQSGIFRSDQVSGQTPVAFGWIHGGRGRTDLPAVAENQRPSKWEVDRCRIFPLAGAATLLCLRPSANRYTGRYNDNSQKRSQNSARFRGSRLPNAAGLFRGGTCDAFRSTGEESGLPFSVGWSVAH